MSIASLEVRLHHKEGELSRVSDNFTLSSMAGNHCFLSFLDIDEAVLPAIEFAILEKPSLFHKSSPVLTGCVDGIKCDLGALRNKNLYIGRLRFRHANRTLEATKGEFWEVIGSRDLKLTISTNPQSRQSRTDCAVCLEPFSHSDDQRMPRLLSCGHSFCTECLEQHCRDATRNHVTCPSCRAPTQLPPTTQLPLNFSLVDQLASLSVREEKAATEKTDREKVRFVCFAHSRGISVHTTLESLGGEGSRDIIEKLLSLIKDLTLTHISDSVSLLPVFSGDSNAATYPPFRAVLAVPKSRRGELIEYFLECGVAAECFAPPFEAIGTSEATYHGDGIFTLSNDNNNNNNNDNNNNNNDNNNNYPTITEETTQEEVFFGNEMLIMLAEAVSKCNLARVGLFVISSVSD